MAGKITHGIPTNAIVLQLLIVNLLLLTAAASKSVVRYTQFSLLLCSLLTVVGVIVLRVTRPKITRPYRVWLYPLPPVLFCRHHDLDDVLSSTVAYGGVIRRSGEQRSWVCCSTFAQENLVV